MGCNKQMRRSQRSDCLARPSISSLGFLWLPNTPRGGGGRSRERMLGEPASRWPLAHTYTCGAGKVTQAGKLSLLTLET